MFPDLDQLRELLTRLHALESQLSGQAEPAADAPTADSVRDEVTRLAHTLHDPSHWRSAHAHDQRHAS